MGLGSTTMIQCTSGVLTKEQTLLSTSKRPDHCKLCIWWGDLWCNVCVRTPSSWQNVCLVYKIALQMSCLNFRSNSSRSFHQGPARSQKLCTGLLRTLRPETCPGPSSDASLFHSSKAAYHKKVREFEGFRKVGGLKTIDITGHFGFSVLNRC